VNGTNWKNDRETLLSIMYNIKSPPKIKRHSTCTTTENKLHDNNQIPTTTEKEKVTNIANSSLTNPSSD
jgi:hypothetical protein